MKAETIAIPVGRVRVHVRVETVQLYDGRWQAVARVLGADLMRITHEDEGVAFEAVRRELG